MDISAHLYNWFCFSFIIFSEWATPAVTFSVGVVCSYGIPKMSKDNFCVTRLSQDYRANVKSKGGIDIKNCTFLGLSWFIVEPPHVTALDIFKWIRGTFLVLSFRPVAMWKSRKAICWKHLMMYARDKSWELIKKRGLRENSVIAETGW